MFAGDGHPQICEPSGEVASVHSSSEHKRKDSVPAKLLPKMSIDTFVTSRVEELAPFWTELQNEGSSPMQQYLWSKICCTSLPLNGEPYFLAVKTGLGQGAVAPLVRAKGVVARFEHLGVKFLHEPADLVYSDLTALRELCRQLVKLGGALFLERVPADSPAISALQEAYQGRGRIFLRASQPYPRILLHEGWRIPENQLNSGRRSDLRRAVRNAEKSGSITYEILSPTPEQLEPLLEEALEVEAANWKGREGSAVARDKLRGRFYRQFAVATSSAGVLRLCFLRVAGKAIAMQYALECSGAFWLLKIGYREEYARCSPGMLLIAETIRYAASQNLSSYEFLGTAANWTRIWTQNERQSVTLRAYPFQFRGLAALAVDACGALYRRMHAAKETKQ